MRSTLLTLTLAGAVLVFAEGCGGGALAQPFESLKGANITLYRQQNTEPPPAPAQAQPQSPVAIPPQITQFGQAVAAQYPGLAPLLNMIPGQGTPAAPPTPDAPRFHDFRILGWVPLNDAALRAELLDVLGHASNFTTPKETCMYAEMGVSITQPNNQPPADVLVSLSCANVRTFGFAWPYGNSTGLTPDATKRLVQLMSKAFAGGH
jgi:hypothetical protein